MFIFFKKKSMMSDYFSPLGQLWWNAQEELPWELQRPSLVLVQPPRTCGVLHSPFV